MKIYNLLLNIDFYCQKGIIKAKYVIYLIIIIFIFVPLIVAI